MPPIRVGILLFGDVTALDFCGPYEVFRATRPLGVPTTEPACPFEVFTVAPKEGPVRCQGGLRVQPDYRLDNHPPIDVLVVPGGWGTRREVDNPSLIDWIRRVAQGASLVTSVCTGAFLLAQAGLLDGKKVTTHWASLERMRESFPQTEVLSGVRFVDQGQVVTSAGVSAGLDMALHIVRRLFGPEVARQTARQLEYHWQEGAL